MNRHTPGPWEIRECQCGAPTCDRWHLHHPYGVSGLDIADAALIAAAPDLLEALYDALPYVEDVLSDPEQLACFKKGVVQRHAAAIRAAITKARGQEVTA